MTDADTNLSNLTTLWLLLGAYMVFLMQVSDDFLFISYHPSFFFRTNWRRLGDILKKCSETTQRVHRNGGFKAAAKDAILCLLK